MNWHTDSVPANEDGILRPVLTLLVLVIALGLAAPTYGAPITCKGLPATIVGTPGDDWIVGTPGRDVIHALAGDDVIRAGGGVDDICAGDGADVVRGGGGDDFLYGGRGNDVLSGEQGWDEIFDNEGNDVSFGGRGNDVIFAEAGNDRAFGGEGADYLLDRTGGNDKFCGGPGTDTFEAGRRGAGAYFGGSGRDEISVSSATHELTLDLTLGTLTLRGTTRRAMGLENVFAAGSGNVTLIGNDLRNMLLGGVGNNHIEGRGGDDYLRGWVLGTDFLDGGDGLDRCEFGETLLNCES